MARSKNYFRQVTEVTGKPQLTKNIKFNWIDFSEKQFMALSNGLFTAFIMGAVIAAIIAYLIH